MCIFCKIINKEIPSYSILETDSVLAFLDLSQTTYGHTLVIPKKHFENIYEIEEESLLAVSQAVKTLAKHYKKVLPEVVGFNIINNNESGAGQTVFHYHVHLIPRYQNDNFSVTYAKNTYNMNELAQKLKLQS